MQLRPLALVFLQRSLLLVDEKESTRSLDR